MNEMRERVERKLETGKILIDLCRYKSEQMGLLRNLLLFG